MKPFDLEVWYGERVAVLGSNGSGKSHFLRLLAAGGSDPDVEHRPVGEVPIDAGAPHRQGQARRPGAARAGSCRPTSTPSWSGRTLLEILHRGDGSPHGRAGWAASRPRRVLDRYELRARRRAALRVALAAASRRGSRSCCSSCRGATLLLLDEPTDNLDVQSAEALEDGLEAFEGTVLAVTHDRWFARGFDRFLVYGADGEVYESDGPVWDEGRVQRAR